jgi:hypothetical protein
LGKKTGEQTMKRLIEFLLEDGTTMLVEVDEPEQGGLVKASCTDNGGVQIQSHQHKLLARCFQENFSW